MVSSDKTVVLTSCFPFLFRARTAQSKKAFFQEDFSNVYQVQRGQADRGRAAGPTLWAAVPPTQRRTRADEGGGPGPEAGRRGGSPKSPLPRTAAPAAARPRLLPLPPPPPPRPSSWVSVRTGAPLTHREGIYVAASSLLTDARRWGPQTSNAAPAAAPRRPRQL